MKIITWNVNGLRAAHRKGFLDWFKKADPDILCIQETKLQLEQVPEELQELKTHSSFFNSANKKGYSGTGIFTKEQPIKVKYTLGLERFDNEGRMIRLDFPNYILINLYMPQGGRNKENLDYKLEAYEHLIKYLKTIKTDIVLLGDFNIAHNEIDLERPKDNINNIMFTPEERKQIDRIINLGFTDTFRLFNEDSGNYTWWPYFRNARQRNIGWRIDYIFTNFKVKDSFILPKVMGSDHCPSGVVI